MFVQLLSQEPCLIVTLWILFNFRVLRLFSCNFQDNPVSFHELVEHPNMKVNLSRMIYMLNFIFIINYESHQLSINLETALLAEGYMSQ